MKSDLPKLKTDSLKWIWFDLDDTLIDFHANSRLAHRLLYRETGLCRYYASPEEWIEVYEVHNKSLWDRYNRGEITQEFLRVDRFVTPLSPHWERSQEDLERWSVELDRLYLDLLAEQTVMIDGALDLLAHLRAHYNIGVLSNGFKDVQYRKLTNTGLLPLVDLTVLSDDIGFNKPDRRLYEYAMRRAGENNPEAHLMIGDNPATDIVGAIAAGWQAIFLDPGSEVLQEGEKCLTTPSLTLLKALF